MLTVLVTGANGFVGRALVQCLHGRGFRVRAAVRGGSQSVTNGAHEVVEVGDLGPNTDWSAAVENCDAVVHTAGRAHVMHDLAADPEAEFHRVNVEGSVRLARLAAEAAIRRFVFVSSIKVNGERTSPGRPFRADDPPSPEDVYGRSKLAAEEALEAVARETGMELVIVRPVLVYGPGVKGNMRSLMRWLNRGVPLPLGAIANRRSLVGIDNLVDLLATCVVHPAAAGETLLVSDGHDVSTTELLRRTASALNRPARLVPIPAAVVQRAGALVGAGLAAERLTGSLQVDVGRTREILGWTPPVPLQESLARMAADYLERQRERRL